jgi:hypothetical protein
MAQWTLLQEWPEFAPQNDAPPPPTAPIPDAPTALEPAWERRETVGTWKAFWQTVRDVLFAPTKVFSALSTEPSFSKAFVFYVVVLVPSAILEHLTLLPFLPKFKLFIFETLEKTLTAQGKSLSDLPPEVQQSLEAFSKHNGSDILSVLLLIPFLIGGFFIGAVVIHLLLLLVRGATRPLSTTLKAMAYQRGAILVFAWVPFIGLFVGLFWGFILLVIALSRAHEVPVWKVLLALLLPIIFCCCSCAALSLLTGLISG